MHISIRLLIILYTRGHYCSHIEYSEASLKMKAIIFKLNYLYSQVLVKKIREQVFFFSHVTRVSIFFFFLAWVFLPLKKMKQLTQWVQKWSCQHLSSSMSVQLIEERGQNERSLMFIWSVGVKLCFSNEMWPNQMDVIWNDSSISYVQMKSSWIKTKFKKKLPVN